MPDITVEEAVNQNCQALLTGDLMKVMNDLTPEAARRRGDRVDDSAKSGLGQSRRFGDVRRMSDLPPTALAAAA